MTDKKIDMKVLSDSSECIRYDNDGIPFALQYRMLSQFANKKAICHWHDDLELIYILDGEMSYKVNDKELLLTKGQCIVVNSHQMHYGYAHRNRECRFVCVLFHPDLLKANLYMYQTLVEPVINSPSVMYWYFPEKQPWFDFILTPLSNLCVNSRSVDLLTSNLYQITGLFHILWNILYENTAPEQYAFPICEDPNLLLQKSMISFVYTHYAENIELKDIAAAGNISPSKCCKLFQKYHQESPVSFLNSYRMEISRGLLRNTSYSITQIALSCGYNHLSYYSKMFMKRYGCTPNAYRKKYRTCVDDITEQ